MAKADNWSKTFSDIVATGDESAIRLYTERARADFPFFCRAFLRVRPKRDVSVDGIRQALVPFVFNEAQVLVWNAMAKMISEDRPVRLVICKARQVGISTFFCAYVFWRTWRESHVHSLLAAQVKTTLATFLETMNIFYESLPSGYRPATRSGKRGSRVSKTEMYFADRQSQVIITPANPEAGRGIAVQHALCSEVASYKDPDEFFGSFMPAMGRDAGTTLIMESSPKDGWFWEKYSEAKFKTSVFEAIFIPWWRMTSLYAIPVTKRQHGTISRLTDAQGQIVTFSKEERREQAALSKLAAKKGLPPITDAQMLWRQRSIENDFDGDEEFFNQEFPRDDISCFERATKSAFKSILPLVRQTTESAEERFPNIIRGVIQGEFLDNGQEPVGLGVAQEHKPGWIDQERRPGLLMFEEPKPTNTYVIGADVADGVEGGEDEDLDADSCFSVVCVYCCNTREQVAEWRGRIDPHDFADVIAKLGYYYGNVDGPAMINVEINNMGHTTVDRLSRYIQYPNPFKWPKFDESGVLTKKDYWETNARTKQLMIAGLRVAVRDGLFIVRSAGLMEEMANYQVHNGRYRAGSGTYADRIIAAALAWQCVAQTEFGYKHIVLGASGVDSGNRQAAGAAERHIVPGPSRLISTPPKTLPDELRGAMGSVETDRINDIWGALRDPWGDVA